MNARIQTAEIDACEYCHGSRQVVGSDGVEHPCSACEAAEFCNGPMPEQLPSRYCVPMTCEEAEEQLNRPNNARGNHVASILPEFMLALRGLDKRNQEAVRTLLKGGLGL